MGRLRHVFDATLASVVCAILCGAKGYQGIVDWLHALPVEGWHLLGFRRRPPKYGAIRNLLIALSPEEFQRALGEWIEVGLGIPLDGDEEAPLQPVSIDGKSLRGTLKGHERAVHLLSALDHKTGGVLHQMQVDSKTNESKTVLKLLEEMLLKGRVIVGDAGFCYREVCQKARDDGGHYLVQVKDNQPTLKTQIASAFCDTTAPFYMRNGPLRPEGILAGSPV